MTVQDPSGSSAEILQLLKHNFGSRFHTDLHYNGDRSPFFIPLTASWAVQTEDRLSLLESLLQYITSRDNVVFASMKEIAAYAKKPVKVSEMVSGDYTCVTSTVT